MVHLFANAGQKTAVSCHQQDAPRAGVHSLLSRRRVVAWIGLLLLLVNVLSSALVAPRPALAAPAGVEQIIICTPSGLRVISLDAQGNPLEQKEKAREGYCPLCLPLNNASIGALPVLLAALWSLPSLAVAQYQRDYPQWQHENPPRDHPGRLPVRPRDPPAFS